LSDYQAQNKLRSVKTPGNHNRYFLSDIQAIKKCQQENQPLPIYSENSLMSDNNSKSGSNKEIISKQSGKINSSFGPVVNDLQHTVEKFNQVGAECVPEDLFVVNNIKDFIYLGDLWPVFNVTYESTSLTFKCLAVKIKNGYSFGYLVLLQNYNRQEVFYLTDLKEPAKKHRNYVPYHIRQPSDLIKIVDKELNQINKNASAPEKKKILLYGYLITVLCLEIIIGFLGGLSLAVTSLLAWGIGGLFISNAYLGLHLYPDEHQQELLEAQSQMNY
jgi:hypothetical protein